MSRRQFIRKSGAGAAALGLGLPLYNSCAKSPAGRTLKEIGLQVFTIRTELEKDWKAALQKVAQIGYDNLEIGGPLGGLSTQAFRDFLLDIGLNPLSGGASMAEFLKSTDNVIRETAAMGKKILVCFWPWADSPENKTLEDFKRLGDTLNRIGKKAKEAGLLFCYHNHDLEFRITEGKIPYDVILEGTDPSLVSMEIDLYWIEKGGQKPIPYFEKHPGRFPVWHVKDMDHTQEKSFACVGQGVLDFPALFAKADLAGLKHVFVEQDQPASPMECIQTSFDYLKKLRY